MNHFLQLTLYVIILEKKIPFLCRGQCEEFGLAVMEHAAADEVTDLASEADILMWRTAAGSALFFVTHKAWKVG